MYTLQNAARVLRVSVTTVKRWIKQDNIEVTILETDRKRAYMTYHQVIALADKHRPLAVKGPDQEKIYQDMTGLYSIEDVGKIFGISKTTVEKWLALSSIEKKLIVTDRRRAYISYSDLVLLAEKYNRAIPHDDLTQEQADNTQDDCHPQYKKLYTIAEAALFLGVTEASVRNWLPLHNIEKKTLDADKLRIYITYDDILDLASKQKCNNIYPINLVNDVKEIKYRLEKVEAAILNLEKYIKRSVYLGS